MGLDLFLNDFDYIRKDFEREENRAPFFDMSSRLLDAGLRTEACVLLLSTWNFASFRYVVNKFDRTKFDETMENFNSIIQDIKDVRFTDKEFLNLPEATFEKIESAFNVLQEYKIKNNGREIPVIGPTGASKLMHLSYPELFIIWDGYIRGEKSDNAYLNVNQTLCKSGWKRQKHKYAPDVKGYGVGYVRFLKQMKEDFGSLIPAYTDKYPPNHKNKQFTKAIDEVNYMGITKPLQEEEKKKREIKKREKKLNKKITNEKIIS